ncbi:GerAB/ArcD/ProY family transporter [Candidatus Woesearchaeota archaeon]|nr:GerAB/ArcD/ProY family transporter [Candidatus Woesearchaeota archaeon]
MDKKVLIAAAMLVGTTIGAGVLGLPYVVAKSGAAIGVGHIIIIGLAVILLNLYVGEIVLRTKEKHQLTGYAGQYLGRNGKRLMALSMILLNYGALTAYIIGVGVALSSILPISSLTGSMLFFIPAAAIVYLGLKAVAESESVLTSAVIVLVVSISAIALISESFQPEKLAAIDLSKIALPFGVVLFAFAGAIAIPEMSEELGKKKKWLKKAIILGGLAPLIIYTLFAIAVVGVTGSETSQIATVKLGEALGRNVLIAGNLFAIFAMSTSFLTIGLAMKEMYSYDYKLNSKHAWLLACGIPIAAFLLGVKEFILVIGIAGAIAGGLQGIMIVLMHAKAKQLGNRKPEYSIANIRAVSSLIILMFIFGIIYSILQ